MVLLCCSWGASRLIWERAGLEPWCSGRFGSFYFTAKSKVTAIAPGWSDEGDGSPLGNKHKPGYWKRRNVMGGEFKKKRGSGGGVFCPSAHKKVTVSQIKTPSPSSSPLRPLTPLFLHQCWNRGGRKRQEGARGNTPTKSQRWQKGASATASWVGQENKRSGHHHKAEPPEAEHLHSLCLFPATLLPLHFINDNRCCSALRGTPAHTNTNTG